MADQAKAYSEAAKLLGGFTGSPEGDYTFSVPDGVEGEFDKDSPLLKSFAHLAKEMNMNQESFTKIIHTYIKGELDGDDYSRGKELSAIDSDPAKRNTRVSAVSDWGQANLNDEQYQHLRTLCDTAENFKLLESLIALTKTPKIPSGDGIATGDGIPSEAELKDRVADPKYQTDPAFRKETEIMFQKKYGTQPAQKVVS